MGTTRRRARPVDAELRDKLLAHLEGYQRAYGWLMTKTGYPGYAGKIDDLANGRPVVVHGDTLSAAVGASIGFAHGQCEYLVETSGEWYEFECRLKAA